jgi:hypothetical protein
MPFALVATEYADAARACGRADAARSALTMLAASEPGIDVLRALARLDPRRPPRTASGCWTTCASNPRCRPRWTCWPPARDGLDADGPAGAAQAVAAAAKPLQRYRCAACGFEAQHWFWQCPGCLSWDSYPPRRIEEQ